jgi:RimJ/RimL family protein N-acetyltransferase
MLKFHGGDIMDDIPIVDPKDIKLETDRLNLIPLSEDDAETIYSNVKEYEIAKWLINLPHPYPEDGAIKFIRETNELMKKGNSYELAIRLKSTNELIGVMAFCKVDKKNRNSELGYWITQKYWNSGFASEAAKRILEFGFNVLNLERVFAKCVPENEASKKVMEKIGMQYEGTMRHEILKENQYYDMCYYGIIIQDWKENFGNQP